MSEKGKKMKRTLQLIIQTAFLALFILLFISGRIQLWMGLFLLGIAASFLLGRIYCGWICSTNTVMVGVSWIKKKLHIKSLKIPTVFTKPWVRYLTLGLFIITFIFSMVTGKRIPVLPALFAMGVLVTLLFPEELWHRYLCPYGNLMSLPASQARHTMLINEESCNNCGTCMRVCPAKAVEKSGNKHRINKAACLVCMKCSGNCSKNAISWK